MLLVHCSIEAHHWCYNKLVTNLHVITMLVMEKRVTNLVAQPGFVLRLVINNYYGIHA